MPSNAPNRGYANWLARAVYKVEHLRLQLKVTCPWSAGIPAPSSVAPVRRVDQTTASTYYRRRRKPRLQKANRQENHRRDAMDVEKHWTICSTGRMTGHYSDFAIGFIVSGSRKGNSVK